MGRREVEGEGMGRREVGRRLLVMRLIIMARLTISVERFSIWRAH